MLRSKIGHTFGREAYYTTATATFDFCSTKPFSEITPDQAGSTRDLEITGARFYRPECPSCHPTHNVQALKEVTSQGYKVTTTI